MQGREDASFLLFWKITIFLPGSHFAIFLLNLHCSCSRVYSHLVTTDSSIIFNIKIVKQKKSWSEVLRKKEKAYVKCVREKFFSLSKFSDVNFFRHSGKSRYQVSGILFEGWECRSHMSTIWYWYGHLSLYFHLRCHILPSGLYLASLIRELPSLFSSEWECSQLRPVTQWEGEGRENIGSFKYLLPMLTHLTCPCPLFQATSLFQSYFNERSNAFLISLISSFLILISFFLFLLRGTYYYDVYWVYCSYFY